MRPRYLTWESHARFSSKKDGRVIQKEAVQNIVVFWEIGSEDIVKCGIERTTLRRAYMNISHRREDLVDTNLEFSVGEEFANDESKFEREFEINQFGDKAFMPRAIECFPDIQEDISCKQFGVKPANDFVGNSQKLVSAAMA
ncbi:hypothetical protein AVEN_210579-1 [Araneus ventricosus]|uniref:Uncharacterized protein n=1 Tax=Araneus ventricosus TaxID=182803 RepID=A0A4Y2WQ51_ARAVE|nr:hypothetical protein AVEN_267890-1 [Araneus ventricosus]GBO38087.1 hypothetical protein AVEN_210579-1 [Araneus ventricosus]